MSARFQRRLRLVVACCTAAPALLSAQAKDTIPSPFDLLTTRPGDAPWARLMRLRNAETVYRGSDQWWDTYAQARSDHEHRVGNHAAALRFDDLRAAPRNLTAPLPAGVHAVDAWQAIAAAADTARVIMVNERHHAASDRLLTLHLLPVLWAKGYRYFAAEAFGYLDTMLVKRGYPIERLTGYYTDDPVFGEVVREALRLGYQLVPYESQRSQEDTLDGHTPQERRDSIEAKNLYDRTIRADPRAKVLVHAGYSHVLENVSPTWHPMPLYFRGVSGVDAVTVDQTRLSERSSPEYEHPAYRAAIDAGLLKNEAIILYDSAGRSYTPANFQVDFQVLNPRTTYDRGRPSWMSFGGQRTAIDVATPECATRICIVEARADSEPDDAVALDRAEVVQSASVRLFLPRGESIRLRIGDANGVILRRWTVRTGR